MSFCKNCGANVGENKFCANCGAPVEDTLVNTTTTKTTSNGYSDYYTQICEYERKAKSIFIFGILSIICCMGIGLIFEIINIILSGQMKSFQPLMDPNLKLTNSVEIDKLKRARSKHKIGALLSSIALGITGVLLFVLIIGIAISVQTA